MSWPASAAATSTSASDLIRVGRYIQELEPDRAATSHLATAWTRITAGWAHADRITAGWAHADLPLPASLDELRRHLASGSEPGRASVAVRHPH